MNFRDKILLLQDSPLIRRIVRGKDTHEPWTATRRLTVALANYNEGQWWVCTSNKSVADIERRFIEGSVGSVLYSVVGGILGNHKSLRTTGKRHYTYMQLVKRDYYIDLALTEIGLTPIAKIEFEQITQY